MKCCEIWQIDLNPTVGAEIKKSRPCIIVNDDAVGILPLRVIVPLTEWNARYNSADWMVKIAPDGKNRLTKPSAADCFQVRSVSTNRFLDKIGEITAVDFDEIKRALQVVFNL